tara:strand:- start:49 stop:333 length:285 start_codon:yes stop_codon:yes gene_type:complete
MSKTRKYDPVWKRWETVEVVKKPKPNWGYEQQLELNLNKPRDATPEEFEKWYKEHLEPLGDAQLSFIAVMAVVQFTALATMMMSFYLIGLWANG